MSRLAPVVAAVLVVALVAHGTPDYGVTAGQITTYQLKDLAELAARLGSIDTHDRRGDVVLLDSFEDGIPRWDGSTASGVTAVVAPSMRYARHGRYSLRLVTGTAAPTLAQARCPWAAPAISPLGLELAWIVPTAPGTLTVELYLYDGTTLFTPAWQYLIATTAFQFRNNAGVMTTLDTVNLNFNPPLFHVVKMVCDFTTSRYSRIILNNRTYTAGLTALPSQADATTPRLEIRLSHDRAGVGALETFIDDVILTQNEPV